METDSSHTTSATSFGDGIKTHHKEIPTLLRKFSFKERLAFWGLFWIFIIGALGLARELHSNYSIQIPREGGSFTEGVVGRPAFINPVLALSDTDKDLSLLVYSGLLRATPEGDFIPDLAESFEADESGSSYSVVLKEGLTWHDGTPLTANDIVFTINKIKDPLIKSPLRPTWEGVSVFALDDRTLEFSLEQPYSLFIENLTTGIIPEHIWGVATTEDFINNANNTDPIGSGPYYVEKIKRNNQGIAEYYVLQAFEDFALAGPFVEEIVIRFYSDEEELRKAFDGNDIDLIGGATAFWMKEKERDGENVLSFPLARIFAVFLNQSQAQVFTQPEIREVLNLATDKDRIVRELLAGYGTPLNGPLPPGALGFTPSESLFSKNRALEILEENGWTEGPDGFYEKEVDDQLERLVFSLSTANVPELKRVAELLQEDWGEIGIRADIKIFEIGDLNQEVIRPRNYSALLFGEVTGRDPDPFAFWHSSQRLDPGLNIALYTNVTTDKLLEDARTILDTEERAQKYEAFQEEVIAETPSIFLYSPEYLYVAPEKINNITPFPLTISSERFINVNEWFVETDTVWNFLNQNNND
ncbi:hypothetical protein CL654_01440 [bacterium]|nr:hypothetical protein [bacterium]